MNEFNKHIFRQGALWVGRYGQETVSSTSIFGIVSWVNRHRAEHGECPLDLWIAQQYHWGQHPNEITRSKGVAA